MKLRRTIFIVVLLLVCGVACGGILMSFNHRDKEIVFIAIQSVPEKEEGGMKKKIAVLINKAGQYFTIPMEEYQKHGNSFMEIKEYYSKVDYEVEGKICNPAKMEQLYYDLKKIDLDTVTKAFEYMEREPYAHFQLVATVEMETDRMDGARKSTGLPLYIVNDVLFSLQVEHLKDKYAVQIVNNLLAHWPLKNGEAYIEREEELTEEMSGKLILY